MRLEFNCTFHYFFSS